MFLFMCVYIYMYIEERERCWLFTPLAPKTLRVGMMPGGFDRLCARKRERDRERARAKQREREREGLDSGLINPKTYTVTQDFAVCP